MMIGRLMQKWVRRDVPKFEIGVRSPLLFLHIPKTAGVSTRQFLTNQYHAKDICPWSDWRSLSLNEGEIRGYKLIQGHFGINIRQVLPADFRALTILRDPIERTLSSIRHMQRDPQFHPLHHRVKKMTVSQILQEESLASYFRNAQTGYLSSQQPPREILRYLRAGKWTDADPADIEGPADLDRAKRQLDAIEFVGLCEDIGSLFSQVCDEMLFHFPMFPPRINVAPRNEHPPPFEITEKDVGLLREVNNLDIALYEYARSNRHRFASRGLDFKALMRKLCARGIYRAQSRSFQIDMGDPIPGSGWYGAERGKRTIRWTGPLREFSLELPIEAQASYRVRLRFMSPIRLRADGFRIMVNRQNQSVKLRHWLGTVYEASCVIDKELLAMNDGLCELVFQTAGVIGPSSRRSADVRRLGVAVLSTAFDRLGR